MVSSGFLTICASLLACWSQIPQNWRYFSATCIIEESSTIGDFPSINLIYVCVQLHVYQFIALMDNIQINSTVRPRRYTGSGFVPILW